MEENLVSSNFFAETKWNEIGKIKKTVNQSTLNYLSSKYSTPLVVLLQLQ